MDSTVIPAAFSQTRERRRSVPMIQTLRSAALWFELNLVLNMIPLFRRACSGAAGPPAKNEQLGEGEWGSASLAVSHLLHAAEGARG